MGQLISYYAGKSGRGKVKFPEVTALAPSLAPGELEELDLRSPPVATVRNVVAVSGSHPSFGPPGMNAKAK